MEMEKKENERKEETEKIPKKKSSILGLIIFLLIFAYFPF